MIAQIDKISKSFAGRVLYTGASLQLNAHERWGLVGPNGAGKTTLLNIVMGKETSDSGAVTFAKNATVGYLEQEMTLSHEVSALDEVINSATEIKQLEARITCLEHDISSEQDARKQEKLLAEYGQVQDRFERLGGYELEARGRQILAGLGFPVEDFDKPADEFSGGWQMRICLSKLLLRHPDVLLLDEPTNHLDLESVQWLEKFLTTYDGAVLLVSHDRAFMDACVSHIAAIENRRITTYTGNYSSYLKQREDNLEQMRAKRAAQEREIAHMQVFVDKFRYKPTKAAAAQERMKRIEQIKSELVILPEGHKQLHFSFPEPPRTGDEVVALNEVAKSYEDNFVYEGVNLKLYRGDHVALVGPNGAGKSTLMKLICGAIAPDKGSIELGQNVSLAYYAQHQLDTLRPSYTVMQEMDEAAPSWTSSEERRLLGAFLFHGDDVEKRVSVLSGGEKARLALARMLAAPAPLLCLDEPTNHLDIDSVSVLEDALVNFSGTIILISHDEHLVRAIANKVVDVRDHKVTLYDGDYEYYLYKKEQLENGVQPPVAPSEKLGKTLNNTNGPAEQQEKSNFTMPQLAKEAPRRTYKTKEQRRAEAEARNAASRALKNEKKRLGEIEAALEPARARYQELMELMASEELYANTDKFDACMKEYQALSQKIPLLEEEWLTLSEVIESHMNEQQ